MSDRNDAEIKLRRSLGNWRKWYLLLGVALLALAVANAAAGNAREAVLYLSPIAVTAAVIGFLSLVLRRKR